MINFHCKSRTLTFYLVALLLAGCGAATVTPTFPTASKLPRPDRILVYDFAVTPSEVDLDRGISPTVLRAAGSETQSQEEIQVGKTVARALTDSLVQELRAKGIDAYRAADSTPPGRTTASIKGRFMRIDQGDRTMRTLVGFGLGGSELRTHIQIFQGTGLSLQLVAEADTSTQSNLKPGLGPMLGVGAAAGTLAVAGAVGGTSTIVNETAFATVQADAKRTATEVAERIADYYRHQGWI